MSATNSEHVEFPITGMTGASRANRSVISGAAMAFSSVSVVFNALRLRRFRSQRTDAAAGATPATVGMREAVTA